MSNDSGEDVTVHTDSDEKVGDPADAMFANAQQLLDSYTFPRSQEKKESRKRLIQDQVYADSFQKHRMKLLKDTRSSMPMSNLILTPPGWGPPIETQFTLTVRSLTGDVVLAQRYRLYHLELAVIRADVGKVLNVPTDRIRLVWKRNEETLVLNPLDWRVLRRSGIDPNQEVEWIVIVTN